MLGPGRRFVNEPAANKFLCERPPCRKPLGLGRRGQRRHEGADFKDCDNANPAVLGVVPAIHVHELNEGAVELLKIALQLIQAVLEIAPAGRDRLARVIAVRLPGAFVKIDRRPSPAIVLQHGPLIDRSRINPLKDFRRRPFPSHGLIRL